MPESVFITLEDDDLGSLFEDMEPAKDAIVKRVFCDLSEAEHTELLAGFCDGDRESYNSDPIVQSVSIDEIAAEGHLSGVIYVHFTGSAYYGCRDMDRLDEHEESVRFCVDRATKEMWFETCPPPPLSERYDEL